MSKGNLDFRDDATFEAFKAWLATKPTRKRYSYLDNWDCAYAQFLKETGRAIKPLVGGYDWVDMHDNGRRVFDENHRRPHHLIDERLDGWAFDNDPPLAAGTFGGILQRITKGN